MNRTLHSALRVLAASYVLWDTADALLTRWAEWRIHHHQVHPHHHHRE